MSAADDSNAVNPPAASEGGVLGGLGVKNAAEAAENFGGFIPGLPGHVVSAVGAGVSGDISGQEELADLEKSGIRLRSSVSSAAKRKLRALENRGFSKVKHVALVGAASIVSGFVAATLLSTVLPFVPFIGLIGGLIGSLAGGYIAEKIYADCTPHEQDGVKLVATAFDRQRHRQKIDEQDAACLMWANLGEKQQKKYEEILERKAGTRDFAEVACRKCDGDGKCTAAINEMMQDPVLEDKLRAYYDIPVDINKSVYQQLADVLNDPQHPLDVRDMVLNPERISDAFRSRERLAMMQAMNMPADFIAAERMSQPLPYYTGRSAGKPMRTA